MLKNTYNVLSKDINVSLKLDSWGERYFVPGRRGDCSRHKLVDLPIYGLITGNNSVKFKIKLIRLTSFLYSRLDTDKSCDLKDNVCDPHTAPATPSSLFTERLDYSYSGRH
jgi:hypothetical protein